MQQFRYILISTYDKGDYWTGSSYSVSFPSNKILLLGRSIQIMMKASVINKNPQVIFLLGVGLILVNLFCALGFLSVPKTPILSDNDAVKHHHPHPSWNYQTAGNVSGIDLSADGQYLIVAEERVGPNGVTGTLACIETKSSAVLWDYTSDGSIQQITFSYYGEYILLSDQGKVAVLYPGNGSTIWESQIQYSVSADVSDAGYVALGDQFGQVSLYHIDSLQPIWEYSTGGIPNIVRSIRFSGSGEYNVSGDGIYTHYFERANSAPIWSSNHPGNFYGLDLSYDSEYILTLGGNTSIGYYAHFFKNSSTTPLWTFYSDIPLHSPSMDRDGETLTIAGYDVYHRLTRGSNSSTWGEGPDGMINSATLSENGEYVAITRRGEGDDKLSAGSSEGSEALIEYVTESAEDVVMSHTGTKIAVAGNSSVLFINFAVPSQPVILDIVSGDGYNVLS